MVWEQPVYVQKKDSFFVFRKGELYVYPDDTLIVNPVTSVPVILLPGQVDDTLRITPFNPYRYFLMNKHKQLTKVDSSEILPAVRINTKLKKKPFPKPGRKRRKLKLFPGQYVRSVLQIGSSEEVRKFSKEMEVDFHLMPERRLKKKITTGKGYYWVRVIVRKQSSGAKEEIISYFSFIYPVSSLVRRGCSCGLKKPVYAGDKLIVEIKYLGFINVINHKKIGQWGSYVGQLHRTRETYIRVPAFYHDSNQIQNYSFLEIYDARNTLLFRKENVSADFKLSAFIK